MCARRVVSALVFSALTFACNCLNLSGQAKKVVFSKQPGSITLNAPNAIHSMDPANTIYSSIQITRGTISSLSSQPAQGGMTLPAAAAVYPGFIDSHSHAISLLMAQATDASGNPYWISLANVNVMLLQDCSTPMPGSTTCFTPIKTQEEVNSLLKNAKPNAAKWVLGWNYEPSRLACKINGSETYGPLCPNFENQNTATALQQLDQLQPTTPLLVTSESGHIVYVNSAALKILNICNVSSGSTSSCYKPTVNTVEETQLARTGQLDEDIAIYAIGLVEGKLAENYGGSSKEKQLEFYSKQIETSLDLYSQIGYTTVQEGAASSGVIEIYMATAATMAGKSEYLPVTMAFLEYDGTTANDFGSSVSKAQKLQGDLSSGGYDMFIAGMKAFADGSNQGYTGDMSPPVVYENQSKPFLDPNIFRQPYDGLPDYDQQGLTIAMNAAHEGGFPLWVHTNGRLRPMC
jgi:predicted amidohydrolase YtcJ